MTTPRIEKIGLVADYSRQGDWAFETALEIARARGASLNVFHFLESPYKAPLDRAPSRVPAMEVDDQTLVQMDRELREYYDERLGDFVEVGFRVCDSGRHNLELRLCLKRKEYQVLVIPHLGYGAPFGNMPIEEFAYRFNAPIILVGPERPDQRLLNTPAQVILGSVSLPLGAWSPISAPSTFQTLSVI